MRSAVRRSVAGLACLLLLSLAGCQPLNQSGKFTLYPTKEPFKLVEVSAPTSEQKVSVTVTATQPVSAYLCIQDNVDKVQHGTFDRTNGPKADLLLGSGRNQKEISFDAVVPAKQAFTLIVTGDKEAEVTYKIVSR
jgi:hypothetical protein